MDALDFYRFITARSELVLRLLLRRRLKNGKEDPERFEEKLGNASLARPKGTLVWLHAASVGEAQSALALIERLLKADARLHILVTTGTVTSARMMANNLPQRAFHQYAPFDYPQWVEKFLNHWRPDVALWMESEIWPNMLLTLQARKVPLVMVNARLSDKSFGWWKRFKKSARRILAGFDVILTQTEKDEERFEALGARKVLTTGNLKFSAKPLGFNEKDFETLSTHLGNRPLWLYASTHKGEEAIACRVHERLKPSIPDLLTIIVPRHPVRRDEIKSMSRKIPLNVLFRGMEKMIPGPATDIYIADTMGELGLFYRVTPVSCIGRSFSDDGGGGHNPIEAAQLHCAVLYGPHVQYQQEIYDEMEKEKAAVLVASESELTQKLHSLLTNMPERERLLKSAAVFLQNKEKVIESVLENIKPLLGNVGDNARLNTGQIREAS